MLNRLSKTSTYIVVITALSLGTCVSFAKDTPWTKAQAAANFQAIFKDNALPTDDIDKEIKEWQKKVQKTNLNLGEESYMLALARFALARLDADPTKTQALAAKELADYALAHGTFPKSSKDFSGFLADTISKSASDAIGAGDIKRAEKLLLIAVDVSINPDSIYAYAGDQLLKTERNDAHEFLTRFLAQALTSKKLTTNAKHKILTFIYANRQQQQAQKQTTSKAESFVPFTGPGVDGKDISVSDFKGKVLLVDFWATWCGPCIIEMPDVVRLYKKYKGKGLRILGVSLDHPNSKDRIIRTMKDKDMDWPVIYDGGYWQAEAAVMNNIRSIPMMYLIDRNGKGRYAGLHGAALEDAIKELLDEK
jgi:thiol-disulfide isomerase/thioredoxin